MIIELIDEAVKGGARREKACALLGLSARGVARWRVQNGGEDRRQGPAATPAHALTDAEARPRHREQCRIPGPLASANRAASG
jgi:hypothetical protein